MKENLESIMECIMLATAISVGAFIFGLICASALLTSGIASFFTFDVSLSSESNTQAALAFSAAIATWFSFCAVIVAAVYSWRNRN